MTPIDVVQRREFAQTALLAPELIANKAVCPVWIDDGTFWYERDGADGKEYALVDARSGARRAVASRAEIASGLSQHIEAPVDPATLIVGNPTFDLKADTLSFEAFGDSYIYALTDHALSGGEKRSDLNWLASPDGAKALIRRDDNLWLRDLASGGERALTTDGSAYFTYAAGPAAIRALRERVGGVAPEALWSPDGRWILTLQTDDREVPDLPVMEFAPASGVRPRVNANRVSLPGDPKVTEFRMLAIEVDTGRQVEARYPRLAAVRMNSTPFGDRMVWWSANARTAYFVDIERGERKVHVVAFDVASGATRIVFSEESDSYVELSVNVYTPALLAPLPETEELVWYSERSGRGHLYLYDLATGALRHAITSGDWQVRDVLKVDSRRREVFLLAGGVAGGNPYLVRPCLASLDGGDLRVLSDHPGDHHVWRPDEMALMIKRLEGLDPRSISGLSPAGDYFVETVSSISDLPKTYLRRRDGSEVIVLESATGALPPGWSDPEPVRCKAADGVTDVYGLLFKPLGFDPGGHYPLIDYIYGGPQVSNVPTGSFASAGISAGAYLEGLHLSAIGAFVLILDGRGTANREQTFRLASHRAAHTASNLEDHVAAIHALAEQHPQIDLERVGITGFSGGGYMTAHAALRFGDVFKVAVAGGGNYDQALFWHTWGERYHGPFEAGHYATQAAKTYAGGLKGKLMLVHGLMDEGCHPAALFQLVQALIDANKDHELVLLPTTGHDWTGYGMRRRWDYLLTHLTGEAPPVSEAFIRGPDKLFERVKANATRPVRQA